LVMACALGLMGSSDAINVDASNLMPMHSASDFRDVRGPVIMSDETRLGVQADWATKGGPSLLMPMAMSGDELPETSAQRALENFACQLGAIPMSAGKPIISARKGFYERK
jgi:hypothetical protein